MRKQHVFTLIFVWFLLALLPFQVMAQGELQHTGLIEAMPAGGGAGEWVVGGETFLATAGTEFLTEKGPLGVGVCAQVEYHLSNNQQVATKIASKSADDCGGVAAFHHKGLVQDMPLGGGAGTWLVEGVTFEATTSTTFLHEHGALAVGVCAEVEYLIEGASNVAIKIASKSADDCAGNGVGAQEVHGLLEAMPAEGLAGTWTVNGVDYIATATTTFEQSDGPFTLGGCVEIEFVVQNGQNIAVKIETDDSCGVENIQETRGILESFPADLIGDWQVGGATYTADGTTQFKTDHGAFAVGVCVEVEHTPGSPNPVAHEIQTKSADDCGLSTPGELEARGLIDTMPADGLIGVWTIGGVTYQANAQTQFDQEHGAFASGVCVEVEYTPGNPNPVAHKIETKRQHDCGGPEEEHEAFGLIEALPGGGLIGAWTIGGLQYIVAETTVLEDGPFFVGLLVEVHFTTSAEGALLATRIEGKQQVSEDDQALAQAYGRIEVVPGPGTLVGPWTIGGIEYQATANTKFEPSDDSLFVVGACVKVLYQVEGGVNTALKIETEPEDDCPQDNGTPLNRAFGLVELMPPNGFIGSWIIAGTTYEVNTATELKEEHGALLVGAYVKVEYVVVAGVRVAREIETHVPPEAGDDNFWGELDDSPGRRQTTALADQIWAVDGQTFTVIDATLLDDAAGALVSGQPVRVNAYTQDGAFIATRVTALEAIYKVYLPLVAR